MDTGGLTERIDTHKMPLDRRKSASTVGDADTCRICRGEGTIEQPLFYPCKCSGSIKYVHQDCLMEWLSHSQKKYCELCKTSFRFTKLYDKSMPTTLPLPLFLRQVSMHVLKTFGRWSRYILVTFIWTCWLPWSIRQIWRGLFWLADGSWMTAQDLKHVTFFQLAAANLSSINGPNVSSANLTTSQIASSSSFDPVAELFNLLTGAPLLKGLLRLLTPKSASDPVANASTNFTTVGPVQPNTFVRQPSLLSNISSLNSLTNYPVVNNGLIDILEGQLICLNVIAAFILVFLIREWVINQQPILNMPNQERADVQAPVIPPNEDARQPGRRRRRGIRRIPDRDEQRDDRNLDAIQRPVVVPRPRRAFTDENVTAFPTSGDSLDRVDHPPRSSSLAPSPSRRQDILNFDSNNNTSWRAQHAHETESLESPPLQRGMLDEIVDIRRSIEERMIPTAEHPDLPNEPVNNIENISTDSSDTSLMFANEINNDHNFDGVQRTDFVFGQNNNIQQVGHTANPAFTFSSPFESSHGSDDSHQEPEIENPEFQESDSSWETLEAVPTNETDFSQGQAALTPSSRDSTDDNDTPPHTLEVVAEEGSSTNVPENLEQDDEIVPDTLFGQIAQWMWHTDETIREEMRIMDQRQVRQGVIEALDEAVNNGHNGVVIRPPANANDANQANAIHDPNAQFGLDPNDPNAIDDAEDLEGVLELIGMEGPLAGMIQNIIFSVFLITLTLSASIWCPYIWGKIAILIMSNPIGVFIKAPLFFISKCGNILIDLCLFLGGLIGYGLSNLTKTIRLFITPVIPSLAAYIKVATVENWAYSISHNSGLRLEKAFTGTIFGLRPDLPTFSMQSHHALRVFRRAFIEASAAVSNDLLDTAKSFVNMWHRNGLLVLPMFLIDEILRFPGATFSAAKQIVEWWATVVEDLKMRPLSEMSDQQFLLVEWTTDDKVIAILVGYAFFAAAGFVYLKLAHAYLGLKKDEKVDGIFADSLRQAGGVLKVIIIIGIEMIAFPLYCGLLLDCALLPLFKEATVQSRMQFLLSTPVTCLFIHWFVGTCYMFHFALFVSMCRKIMRKGVLYFIRDPDDPTFHPVRDVLERPVATQLGKIAFSALVYGGLVMFCLGGVVWTVSRVTGILPVHWATNEPRMAFPVDIIFYNFMLPFILRKAEPSKKISAMYGWWFRQCARSLRLSHFLFGEDKDDEKLSSRLLWSRIPGEKSVNLTLEKSPDTEDPSDVRQLDGRYVRAPAADSVRIPKGTKVFVEVDENNARTDGQPDHDTGMHGKNDERFVKIYIPPHFRARISTFIFLVWLFAASTGIAFTVVPLLVGRSVIRMVAASKVAPNDLYAFTVGMHVCGAIGIIVYMLKSRKEQIRLKVVDLFTNTRESLPRLYQITKHILGVVYVITTVFIILPFITSLLTELYVHMPVYNYFANHLLASAPAKLPTNSASSIPINPTIFILQTWTLGLLYLRFALRLAINFPNGRNRPSAALRAIVRNGYFNPDVALASRALILPALSICIVLLGAPLGLARLVIVITRTATTQEKLQIYRYSYPVLLCVGTSVYAAVGLQNKIEGWRVKIRDEVYLVGERLHNFTDAETGKKKSKVVKVEKGKGKIVAAQRETSSSVLAEEMVNTQTPVQPSDGLEDAIIGLDSGEQE